MRLDCAISIDVASVFGGHDNTAEHPSKHHQWSAHVVLDIVKQGQSEQAGWHRAYVVPLTSEICKSNPPRLPREDWFQWDCDEVLLEECTHMTHYQGKKYNWFDWSVTWRYSYIRSQLLVRIFRSVVVMKELQPNKLMSVPST